MKRRTRQILMANYSYTLLQCIERILAIFCMFLFSTGASGLLVCCWCINRQIFHLNFIDYTIFMHKRAFIDFDSSEICAHTRSVRIYLTTCNRIATMSTEEKYKRKNENLNRIAFRSLIVLNRFEL